MERRFRSEERVDGNMETATAVRQKGICQTGLFT